VRGAASYVLPRFDNKSYHNIKQGSHFGLVDLADEHEFLAENNTSSY
jgi:hypothetical protein